MSRRAASTAIEALFPLAVLGALILWSSGSTSTFIPPVTRMLEAFREVWLFDRFSSDIVPSLGRLAAGYGVAVAVGASVGIALGSVPLLARATQPIVQFMRALPAPALVPFGILILGIGDGMKIFVIAIGSLFPTLLSTIDGVRSVDPTLKATARIYRLSRWDRFFHVTLRAASPQMFAGMRTSLAIAVIMMVVSELVGSTNGIGHFVLQSQRTFDIDGMWAGIILLGVIGFLANALFLLVERHALAWHRAARGAGR